LCFTFATEPFLDCKELYIIVIATSLSRLYLSVSCEILICYTTHQCLLVMIYAGVEIFHADFDVEE